MIILIADSLNYLDETGYLPMNAENSAKNRILFFRMVLFAPFRLTK